jgi:hypothetical protein
MRTHPPGGSPTHSLRQNKAENKSEFRGKFFTPKNVQLKNHVNRAIHHNPTIETPRPTPAFFKNPLKKHLSTTQKNSGNHFARGCVSS